MFIVNKGLSKSNIPRTIRFTEEIYNSLSEIASHENISFNQLVLQCCRYAIDNYGTTEECKFCSNGTPILKSAVHSF